MAATTFMMNLAWLVRQCGKVRRATHGSHRRSLHLLVDLRGRSALRGNDTTWIFHSGKSLVRSDAPWQRLLSTLRGGVSEKDNEALESLKKLQQLLLLERHSHRPSSSPRELLVSSSHATGYSIVEHKTSLEDLSNRLGASYCGLPPLKLDSMVDCLRKATLQYLARQCLTSLDLIDSAVLDFQWAVRRDSEVNQVGEAPGHRRHAPLDAVQQLRKSCIPVFERILRCCVEANTPLGLQLAMELRHDVQQWIAVLKHQHSKHVSSPEEKGRTDCEELLMELRFLDSSLFELLSLWFAPGTLNLDRVTYDATPASVIEIIAKHEAVHPLTSLEDLKRRLAPDRRVFGLFHPLLCGTRFNPVAVIHCSLLRDIPASMPEVHKEHEIKDHSPSVAAFYSISNLQPLSLAGIGLGEYLIKKAVAELQAEFHGDIETYCTLSPLPGFRSWLKATVSGTGKFALRESSSLLTVQTGRDSASASQLLDSLALHLNCPTDRCLVKLVERLDEAGPNSWKDQPEIVYAVVRQLAARYLLLEKHRSKPLDAVARFHIGNGAELYRINVGADLSSKGWRNSYGCMVNYRYVLEDLHRNRIRFEESYGIQTSADFHKPTFQ